ncbi:hypothetical protein [Halarcobacter bivalviorum]|uniref:Auto-transporter adhesin head GIN domain-containing protein n=1 Tax=Halarcobacter bivalviorum TaxID=663364 RepID=A0AAX2A7Q9_9BACT|nr:hypothetical protein [Halarcobacter bivalviorum]AXH11254.1 hypothetical protein ABIV_0215 [Halarcobacter bivalviorum]RXK09524.1 hypothetical protein CRV05_09445 [Halarcobacter bivalviorum]
MIKALFFTLFSINLFAQTIHFQESKYIDALNSSTKKTGYINFRENSIETSYENSDVVLLFEEDTLFIMKNEGTVEIDLTRDMPKKIYVTLLQAIYLDEISKLELYFEVQMKKDEIFLKPKSIVANYIKSINYKKTTKLEYLHINMLNNDRISIEQID